MNNQIVSIIYGTLLGDAWLDLGKKAIHNSRWATVQKKENKEYLEWLYDKLKSDIDLRLSYYRKVKSGFDNKSYEQYYLVAKCSPYFSHLRKIVFYKDGKKKVNQKILSKLTPIGIACWYMDDGSLLKKKDNRRLLLYTMGYGIKENKIIQDYFQKNWGVRFEIDEARGKPFLRANVKNALKFIKIVKPYVNEVKCMRYKLDFGYEILNKSKYKAEYLQVFPEDKDIV